MITRFSCITLNFYNSEQYPLEHQKKGSKDNKNETILSS